MFSLIKTVRVDSEGNNNSNFYVKMSNDLLVEGEGDMVNFYDKNVQMKGTVIEISDDFNHLMKKAANSVDEMHLNDLFNDKEKENAKEVNDANKGNAKTILNVNDGDDTATRSGRIVKRRKRYSPSGVNAVLKKKTRSGTDAKPSKSQHQPKTGENNNIRKKNRMVIGESDDDSPSRTEVRQSGSEPEDSGSESGSSGIEKEGDSNGSEGEGDGDDKLNAEKDKKAKGETNKSVASKKDNDEEKIYGSSDDEADGGILGGINQLFGKEYQEEGLVVPMVHIGFSKYCKKITLSTSGNMKTVKNAKQYGRRMLEGVFTPKALRLGTISGKPTASMGKKNMSKTFVITLDDIAIDAIIKYTLLKQEKHREDPDPQKNIAGRNGNGKKIWSPIINERELRSALSQKIAELKADSLGKELSAQYQAAGRHED